MAAGRIVAQSDADGLRLSRDADGVLLVEMHDGHGGPCTFTARHHERWPATFAAIGADRAVTAVILTGAGGEFLTGVDFASFGDVADPDVWSKVHDEGVQMLENLANIRVPIVAAIEGKAWVHSEYALMADVIVAGAGATFHDTPHFAGGIVPGDGIFTTWAYRAGPGRAQAFLLDPAPMPAATALAWGVVAEVVADGMALTRARTMVAGWLMRPALTLRNTRIHFIQPLKERLVREVGYGLALEGASAAALVKRMRTGG